MISLIQVVSMSGREGSMRVGRRGERLSEAGAGGFRAAHDLRAEADSNSDQGSARRRTFRRSRVRMAALGFASHAFARGCEAVRPIVRNAGAAGGVKDCRLPLVFVIE